MNIGYAFCGSFCTIDKSIEFLDKISSKYENIYPISSFNVYNLDTKFGKHDDKINKIESITNKKIIHTIEDAEPFGPKIKLDLLVIAPCTGNTLAKIANGITDTPVTMAVKAHLRSDRPLVIALASNDALSANLKNIATLLQRKNVYFVPMKQDDEINKPHSLVADFSLLENQMNMALEGKQIPKIFQ